MRCTFFERINSDIVQVANLFDQLRITVENQKKKDVGVKVVF